MYMHYARQKALFSALTWQSDSAGTEGDCSWRGWCK